MAEPVRITDVSPRDGLQNEPGVIPASDKARLVRLLLATGVDEVEVSSFVSPRWVPQLGDAAEVFAQILDAAPEEGGPLLSALVPNEKGMESLLEVNRQAGRSFIGRVALFTAASETFSKRNTNASIAETLDRFEPVFRLAYRERLALRVYVSCAFGCPFEGDVSAQQVAGVVRSVFGRLTHSEFFSGEGRLGPVEISLGDTIGAATPGSVEQVLKVVGPESFQLVGYWAELPGATLNLHLHDTFGRAAQCVRKGLELGVRSFDGAVAGLGGCPYASTPGKRAPGNIDTGLLVRTIEDAGYTTGVDGSRLREAAQFATVLRSRGGAP